MRMLVVEDEPDVAEVIRRALERIGAVCVLAGSVEEALAALEQQEIDAMTLDLCVPGRGGLDWLESLAGTHPELARRTVVITGLDLEVDLIERLARCGAGILAKPFTLESLRDAVRCQIVRSDLPASGPN